MKESRDSHPIKSRLMSIMIHEKLRTQHRPYAILYALLITTGAPLSALLSYTVNDIIFPQDITFKLRSDSPRTITSHIPQHVQEEIGDYFSDIPDLQSPAFISISGSHPMSSTEFRKRLARTSIECGIPAPGINEAGLRKTFLYRKVLQEGSPEGALKFLGWTSAKKLYNYLGITKLVLKDGAEKKIELYDTDIINTVIGEAISSLEEAKVDIYSKDTFDKYDAPAIIALCANIREAVNTYRKNSNYKGPKD